ncbi:hypothetical protein CK203_102511 [Vitis vinifera]|uniref:Uncharacterized protein n=1 Tax=Vitis vinifera TaxID=29760 RepID=A0A438DUZ6_VITVI|nr:hypothetical protein CK203_102511 [Vitis vinifera]
MGVRDSNGVSKGGKCWFAVESKAFEISVEEVRGKLRGTIWERSKGLSSWIRFGEKGLSLLLKGAEAWCRGESNSKLLKVWDEGARKFRLECCSNVAGRFLLCSVRDVERKKFCLVFLEGNGLVGGWFLLAKKLRALGVSSTEVRNSYQCESTMGKVESNVNTSENESGSYAEVVKGKIGESVDSMRVYLGEKEMMCREEQLRLGGALVLFEFQNKWEADMVLLRGSRRCKDRDFLLQRWGPVVGCTWKESHAKEVWVRVVGLPLHLWSREVFKRIGDCCGGFVAVDEETTLFSQLQWARILVKDSGMKWPGSMQMRSEWEVRDEGGGASRVESRVREPQADFQKRGAEVKVACGSESDGGPLSSEDAGWAEGPSSLCPKLSGWTKGLEESIGLFKPEAHLDLLREPVSSRASPEAVGTLAELEQELLVVGSVSGMEPSLGHLKPTDDVLLDEASRYPCHLKLPIFSLEFGASSPSTPFMGPDGVVLGKVGVFNGLVGAVEEARSRVSSCEERLVDISVHEDRNLSPRVTGGEASGPDLAIVPFGGVLESPLVETVALQVEVGEGEEEWSSSCLAKFSHCLGMSTVGFEEEILYLRELRKLEWTETKIKDMSTGIVRSLGALYSMMESGGLSMFPSERIWRARVPPKVAFFVWEAWVKTTLLGWNGGFVGKRRKKARQMAPLCIFWSVWKERNRGSLAESHSSLVKNDVDLDPAILKEQGPNDVVLAQKRKKEIRASLCPLQPDVGEEEKEKKKKEVGDRGAPVDRVVSCRKRAPCAPKRRLREGASPAFRQGAKGWRCTARSLGAPFTIML